ncbi:MAG: hypothetical protein ACR2O3_03815 [Rhizobiaceae bacterium]
MIHMLSRFDLKHEADFALLEQNYMAFFEKMRTLDLTEATGKIGKRVSDTPMDTDAADAPSYYVLMSFKNRHQMDRAYEYMANGDIEPDASVAHANVKNAVLNAVFTCWEE